jgi:chaperonin GroEL
MKAGIIDPTKVVRCALENAGSVARTFLISDVVVTEIPSAAPAAAPAGNEMGGY